VNNGIEAILLFSPTDSYISPAWYPSKDTNGGKVLPTWNYEFVQVHGTVSVVDELQFVQNMTSELTDVCEKGRQDFNKEQEMPVHPAWKVSHAPEPYTSSMSKAIVGVEFKVSAIVGKKKLSQNRPLEDAKSVTQALLSGGGGHAGYKMGATMKQKYTSSRETVPACSVVILGLVAASAAVLKRAISTS
jgi:transcriptional regulator